MRSSAEIQDDITPFFERLFKYGDGLGLQALNKAGTVIRKAMVDDVNRAGSHSYGTKFTNGNRSLVDTSRSGTSKKYYSRESHSNGQKQASMGELVKYKVYPFSKTMLVGWINVKGFNSTFYKAGVPSKGNYVTGAFTKDIAEKMLKGGREHLTDDQLDLFMRSGWMDAYHKGYVDRKPHPYMSFSRYRGLAVDKAKEEFDKAVAQFGQLK